MPSEPVRAWIYRILLACVAVATVYNVIDEEAAVAWGALAAALVGTGLASANTSVRNGK
jgi:uncharacterized membrane protein YjjB (DUF3815 family)